MIRKILKELSCNVDYVLMHSIEKLESVESDIDLLVSEDSWSNLKEALKNVVGNNNGKIISQYNTIAGNLIVNVVFVGDSIFTYRLDFYKKAFLTVYKTYPFAYLSFDSSMFFEECIDIDGINLPSYEVQYAHYLLRKILKKDLNSETLLVLKTKRDECDPKLLEKYFNQLVGMQLSSIEQGCLVNDQVLLDTIIKNLCTNNRVVKFSAFDRLKCFLKKTVNTRGFHVAIIGPDGTGKTTLINSIQGQFSNVFANVHYIHLRPTLVPASRNVKARIKKVKDDIPKPHESKEYNVILSSVKAIILLLDYTLGYWINIYKSKLKNNFIISDRYFYDIFVDPKRFRMHSTSSVFQKLIKLFVPRPDLTLLLMASPEVVYERKQDLDLMEIKRQNIKFQELKKEFCEICEISSEQLPQKVFIDSAKVVIENI